MDPIDFYKTCLRQTSEVFKQVQADQLSNETPDDEWTVRDLLNHILYEVSWVPDMTAGRTMQQVGDAYEGDLLAAQDDDISIAWETAAQKAEQAVENCDPEATAYLSYAEVPNAEYLPMSGGDILVHAWDLAKATGQEFLFDPSVASDMWQAVQDRDMSQSGLFKSSRPYDNNDSDQDKILAKFGRDPAWQAQQ